MAINGMSQKIQVIFYQALVDTFCYQLWLWHTDSFCCSTEWKDSETEVIKDTIADSIATATWLSQVQHNKRKDDAVVFTDR